MTNEANENSTDAALQRAIEAIADTDAHLARSEAHRWMVILESEWPDEGHKTLSIFRSADMPPWDSLGMLRFATLQEEERAFNGSDDDHEDEGAE